MQQRRARCLRPHPAAGRDARHSPSFIDHDGGRGAHIRRLTPAEAVDLTDPELDSRLIRILPPQADSNRSPPGRNRFKKSRSKGIDPVENWTWGLSLIVLTIAIHTTGVIFMAFATVRIRVRLERGNRFELRQVLAINICLIAMVGLLLAALHGIEAALWAAAYWWLGALSSPVEALLYSVDSMSTRGGSGLVLERHWRMMGALEAMDGMLRSGSARPTSSR
jgi:hypothetical protein